MEILLLMMRIKKILDINIRKAPPTDHNHETKIIRGILSEKTNLLVDQWEQGSYGKLSKPPELTKYQSNPPAVRLFGNIKYK